MAFSDNTKALMDRQDWNAHQAERSRTPSTASASAVINTAEQRLIYGEHPETGAHAVVIVVNARMEIQHPSGPFDSNPGVRCLNPILNLTDTSLPTGYLSGFREINRRGHSREWILFVIRQDWFRAGSPASQNHRAFAPGRKRSGSAGSGGDLSPSLVHRDRRDDSGGGAIR